MEEHWSETSMTETCHVRYLEGRLGKESGISSITLRTHASMRSPGTCWYSSSSTRSGRSTTARPSPSTRAQHAGPCLLTHGIVRAAANARPVRARRWCTCRRSPLLAITVRSGGQPRATASKSPIAGNGREGPELGKKERGKGEGEVCIGTDEEMRRGTREDSGRGNGGNAS